MTNNKEATIKEINDKFKQAFDFAANSGCKVDCVLFHYIEDVKGAAKLHKIDVDYKSNTGDL